MLCDFPLHQMQTHHLHSPPPPPPPPPALSTISAISTSCQPSLQIYRPCILSQTNAMLVSPRYSDTFSLRKLPLAAFYAFFNKACARHPPASLWPAATSTSSHCKATSIFFVFRINFHRCFIREVVAKKLKQISQLKSTEKSVRSGSTFRLLTALTDRIEGRGRLRMRRVVKIWFVDTH